MSRAVLRTLYGRMALTLVALFALLALLQVGVQVWTTRQYLLEASQRLNRNLAANLVKQGLIDAEGGVQRDALAAIFHTMMVVNLGRRTARQGRSACTCGGSASSLP